MLQYRITASIQFQSMIFHQGIYKNSTIRNTIMYWLVSRIISNHSYYLCVVCLPVNAQAFPVMLRVLWFGYDMAMVSGFAEKNVFKQTKGSGL